MDRVQPAEGARGVFVSLEGVDGSGKSTQAAILRDLLAQGGADVVSLREPGGTAISEKVRALVLDPANAEMCDECELLLYEASRAQLVRQVVEPALAAGGVVVCDRFLDSTFAYQAAGRGLDAGLVRRANELGSCGFLPDRTVIFDIDPARALARATRGGADRLERSGLVSRTPTAGARGRAKQVSSITSAGRERLRQTQETIYRMINGWSDRITPEDFKELSDALDSLIRILSNV